MRYMYHTVQASARMLTRMPPEDDTTSARERLLAAAMAHVAAHGVGDLSLRALAAALGTSHRMLIYHFGSREGLLIEVIRAVEDQQRAALAQLLLDAAASPSRGGCCSTCSPPATARGSTRRWSATSPRWRWRRRPPTPPRERRRRG